MPVTADDLDQAVQLAVTTLREAPQAAAWDGKAGSLDWDCWETAEHLSDALFSYAVSLGPRTPPRSRDVPFACESRRPGGPDNAVHADRAAGAAGLLQVLEACGALLVAMVRTTPSGVRAYHSYGVSDRRASPRWGWWKPWCIPTTWPGGSGLPGRRPPACARRRSHGCSLTPR